MCIYIYTIIYLYEINREIHIYICICIYVCMYIYIICVYLDNRISGKKTGILIDLGFEGYLFETSGLSMKPRVCSGHAGMLVASAASAPSEGLRQGSRGPREVPTCPCDRDPHSEHCKAWRTKRENTARLPDLQKSNIYTPGHGWHRDRIFFSARISDRECQTLQGALTKLAWQHHGCSACM